MRIKILPASVVNTKLPDLLDRKPGNSVLRIC